MELHKFCVLLFALRLCYFFNDIAVGLLVRLCLKFG